MALPRIEPLTLRREAEPFDDPGWIFELKHDGFRALAYINHGAVQLVSRNRHSFRQFDDLQCGIAAELRVDDAIIDGEIVVLDDDGRSLFSALMHRRGEPSFIAFDLPWLNGDDLRDLPIVERKKRLRRIIPKRSSCVLYLDHVEKHGVALFDAVQAADLEGVVAKPKASPYQQHRVPLWMKIKNRSYSQAEGRHDQFEAYRRRSPLPPKTVVGTLVGGGTTMPRETIKNRAGIFYARRDKEGQFSELDEKGRSLAADRRTKAKAVAKKGEGDRGDQKVSRTTAKKKATSKKRAPAKKR